MRLAAACALLALALVPAALASEQHPTLTELEGEVMCPVCSTTLDQSHSPIAQRIKAFISRRIAAGDTKSQIEDRLVADWGTQILAAPPKKGFNLLVWLLPIAGALLGAAVVALLAWRWSHSGDPPAPPPPLDSALEHQVDAELARFDEG